MLEIARSAAVGNSADMPQAAQDGPARSKTSQNDVFATRDCCRPEGPRYGSLTSEQPRLLSKAPWGVVELR